MKINSSEEHGNNNVLGNVMDVYTRMEHNMVSKYSGCHVVYDVFILLDRSVDFIILLYVS